MNNYLRDIKALIEAAKLLGSYNDDSNRAEVYAAWLKVIALEERYVSAK